MTLTGGFDNADDLDTAIDRRRRKYLARGFIAISAAVVVISVLLCLPLKAWLDDDNGRAQGEQMLAAITLPGGWQDSSVTFQDRGGEFGHKSWGKRLIANSGDLTANIQSLQVAMRAAGWGEATCAATNLPDQPTCVWLKGDFVITGFFTNAANVQLSCPAGWAACARIDFIMYPRAQAPATVVSPSAKPE